MFLDSVTIIHPAFVTFTFAIHRNAQTMAISVLLHLHMNAIRLPIAEDNSSQSEYPFNIGPSMRLCCDDYLVGHLLIDVTAEAFNIVHIYYLDARLEFTIVDKSPRRISIAKLKERKLDEKIVTALSRRVNHRPEIYTRINAVASKCPDNAMIVQSNF